MNGLHYNIFSGVCGLVRTHLTERRLCVNKENREIAGMALAAGLIAAGGIFNMGLLMVVGVIVLIKYL